MEIGWPQGLWIALMIASLLVNANLHGKDRDGKHNFMYPLTAATLQIILLSWGGFFNFGN